MSEISVLVVDDEAGIRDVVSLAIELAGFRPVQAANAHEALECIHDSRPDLMIVDWMMPEVSGVELIRRLRRDGELDDLPCILLTAKVEEDSKITGLESGADDYITKPFSARELVARVKSLLRRQGKLGQSSKLKVAGVEIDANSRRVVIDGEVVKLGPIEYKLLHFFVTHRDKAFSREQLLDRVWGGNVYVDERTVDVHIRRLRMALTKRYEYMIQTVRGVGYMFVADFEGTR